jgi:hypothetical protein
VVDGFVPCEARLLDAAALEVHFCARDQVQGDDARVGVGRARGGGQRVLLGGGPVVSHGLVDLGGAGVH